jgi:hypothetical protein
MDGPETAINLMSSMPLVSMPRSPEGRLRHLQKQREAYHLAKQDPNGLELNREKWGQKQQRRRADPARLEQMRAKDRERRKARLADPVERQKIDARGMINKRAKRKTFPSPGLFVCCDCQSAKAVEYHHETYELWWGVEALCRECHERRHHP